VSYFPVDGRSGTRFGVGVVVVDITARKRLEHMQQDFLEGVSHDLNSPLAALHVRAQVLRRRADREDSSESQWMRDGAGHIEELTTRMVGIVGELADAAHLRVGQALELERAKADLVALVRRAVDEQQTSTTRHRFTVQTAGASLVGDWDALRLERVFANLLGNAVKYSPDGGPVAVGVDEIINDDQSWAVVTIRDQGIGIPAEDVPYIFERRRRGANVVGKIAGAGVGLAGARQIVEQHGGTITVISRECVGSFFEVRLPLSRSTKPAPAMPARSAVKATTV
jgi:signal transduction histidine kinase